MAHTAGAYPGFRSIKRLGVFLNPPWRDASPSLGYPPGSHLPVPHLYTWVERGTVRVKCLAQEHNTMSLATTRTPTAQSGFPPLIIRPTRLQKYCTMSPKNVQTQIYINNSHLLYSSRLSRYSAFIHWLHGNNETVYRQMPRAGNIAKTMTSNGKQVTVSSNSLTARARDRSVQLKITWCCHLTRLYLGNIAILGKKKFVVPLGTSH